MNAIVHNYSSEISSEALYVNKALNDVGFTSAVWNNESSAFDVFDEYKPEVYITTYEFITKDIVKRLENDNIKTLINTTLAGEEILDSIEQLAGQINAQLYSNKKSRESIAHVPYCADIFLKQRGVKGPEYNIDALFVVVDDDDIDHALKLAQGFDTHHIITPSKGLFEQEGVDSYLHLSNLYSVYNNYNYVYTFSDNQFLCDANHYAQNGVLYDPVTDECDYAAKENRTPYDAAAQMMRILGKEDIAERLDDYTR